MQHVSASVRPPAGQSCLMRGGVAVLKVTHSLQPSELPLGYLMRRFNRKPWVKWFWWSPQALISHTWGQSWFFLTIPPHPLCQLREASCSVHIQSQVEFAVRWEHRCFWETFQICTKSFVTADAHVQIQFIHTDLFFPLRPFEMKDVDWEGDSEYLEKTVLPITPWCDPGYRGGSLLSVSSFFYKASFFWCVMVWSVTLAKKSNLGAYLRTQALLLGEILPASIVFIKSHTT